MSFRNERNELEGQNVSQCPHKPQRRVCLRVQVFVELNELVIDRNQELQWRETARWIKFEEEVEETERWGRPHIPSLTFRSLLELRKTISHGKEALHCPLWTNTFTAHYFN